MVHIMAYRATAFTENRKAQTRSRLLKEATRLVSRAGFRGLSIAQVASASGVATGTSLINCCSTASSRSVLIST